MLNACLGDTRQTLRRILCLGAHSDDIEIGCGGSILRLLKEDADLEISWVVLSSTPQRRREALYSARRFLKGASRTKIIIKGFRDGFFPYHGGRIKEFFELLKNEVSPDLIFTHFRNDLHQDHRLIAELTWNTFRDHFILEYEIPKYDGDLGSPNFFFGLDEPTADAKVRNILQSFASQRKKPWFTRETFLALLRIRGIEANAKRKYAEAFYCRKVLLSDSVRLRPRAPERRGR